MIPGSWWIWQGSYLSQPGIQVACDTNDRLLTCIHASNAMAAYQLLDPSRAALSVVASHDR
jgi:hypothetical protein